MQQAGDERSRGAVGWVLVGICPAAFITVLNGFALGPFLPAIGAELGVSVALLGQIPGGVNAVAALLGLILGPLADRYGHRRTLLLGLVAVATSAVASGAASTFALLLAAALVGAVGRAVVTPVSLAIVGSRFAGRGARRAMSYVVAALSGAGVVGIPILTVVAVAVGTWRGAFALLALAVLGIIVLAAVVLPRDVRPVRGPTGPGPLLGALGSLFRHRPTVAVVGSSLLRSSVAVMVFLYWGAFLIEHHGLDVTMAGIGYSAAGLGHFGGSLIAGRWLGEGAVRPRMMAGTVLAGLTLSAALLLPLGPIVAIGLGACGFLMIGGVEVATAMLLSGERLGGRATTMTLNSSGMHLGGALGSAVGGLLLGLGGYPALGAGVPLLALAAALVLWSSGRGGPTPGPARTWATAVGCARPTNSASAAPETPGSRSRSASARIRGSRGDSTGPTGRPVEWRRWPDERAWSDTCDFRRQRRENRPFGRDGGDPCPCRRSLAACESRPA